MNQHQTPTAADFFAQQHEDDDTEPAPAVDWLPEADRYKPAPDTMWVITPDPMERVARTLEALADHFTADKQPGEAFEASADDADIWKQQAQSLTEALHDETSKLHAAVEVIYDVEAALGKSTAKPALAAKAVIDAWRNPQVPVEGEEGEGDPMTPADNGQLEPEPVNAPLSLPGHTRAETGENTPDICQECSYAAQDYVVWPCDTAGAVPPVPVVAGEVVVSEEPPVSQVPANDAPVEAWREYARSQGLAGPHIDKANRSQIRTALGIAHQPTA